LSALGLISSAIHSEQLDNLRGNIRWDLRVLFFRGALRAFVARREMVELGPVPSAAESQQERSTQLIAARHHATVHIPNHASNPARCVAQ
jgi:hypothetical protein